VLSWRENTGCCCAEELLGELAQQISGRDKMPPPFFKRKLSALFLSPILIQVRPALTQKLKVERGYSALEARPALGPTVVLGVLLVSLVLPPCELLPACLFEIFAPSSVAPALPLQPHALAALTPAAPICPLHLPDSLNRMRSSALRQILPLLSTQ